MLILGVDPGLTGALSLIAHGRGLLECADVPACGNGLATGSMKRWVDVPALRTVLRDWSQRHDFAGHTVVGVIERPIPMPNLPAQTIASQFDTFGTMRAELHRCCHAVYYLEPRSWKKRFGLGTDKNKAREVATTLYPESAAVFKRVADHNRAESCLMAHYWMRFEA
jgi:hypothetical protein